MAQARVGRPRRRSDLGNEIATHLREPARDRCRPPSLTQAAARPTAGWAEFVSIHRPRARRTRIIRGGQPSTPELRAVTQLPAPTRVSGCSEMSGFVPPTVRGGRRGLGLAQGLPKSLPKLRSSESTQQNSGHLAELKTPADNSGDLNSARCKAVHTGSIPVVALLLACKMQCSASGACRSTPNGAKGRLQAEAPVEKFLGALPG
jgi:hypothetical protein